MDISERTQMLNKLFNTGQNLEIEDSDVAISFYSFTQKLGQQSIATQQWRLTVPEFCDVTDESIVENKNFKYAVFHPKGVKVNSGCILLLHGLNERSWEKYLCWAEYLVVNTGKPVILFPIAFHMNRTPKSWLDPRWIRPWVKLRGVANATSSFVNYALSNRLSIQPLRFVISGKETIYNICQLGRQIMEGEHALFAKGTHMDIFAYSIGALLSQVLLQSNFDDLFTNSKLVMFCGGSIFNEMNGTSKMIMDGYSFNVMKSYYENDFVKAYTKRYSGLVDSFESSFVRMIDNKLERIQRESFFDHISDRIRAFSLKKDKVIPTGGIIHALGEKCANKCLQEMDFDYEYSHEIPFPMNRRIDKLLLNNAFEKVFSPSATFLR